jgi:hypothetical protein
MANTFELIASVTVGSGGAATISFTSIPATYTDLVVKRSVRGTATGNNVDTKMTFNGITTAYTIRNVYGDGSTAASFADSTTNYTGGEINGTSTTASTFDNAEIYIPNYAGSTNKSFSLDNVVENNATFGLNWLQAGLWSNTAAITSITFTPGSGNFAEHSTAYLYGVKNA